MALEQQSVSHSPEKVRQWAIRHWAALALVFLSVVYGGTVTVLHGDAESPIDETVYLDYTFKVWEQGLVHQGERFGPEIAERVGCDSVIPHGTLGQRCEPGAADIDALPNGGYTTGSGYTPVYFWTVRVIGDPIHALTGLTEVTSWRLSGVVWLSATALLIAMLLRRSGVSNWVTFTLGCLFLASPYVWWTYTYVSTDVSVVPYGAAVLLIALEARRGSISPWWLVPLGLLGPVFKITNLVVFGLVVIWLVIDSVRGAHKERVEETTQAPAVVTPRWKLWAAVMAASVLAVVAQVAWLRIVPLLAVDDVVVDQGITIPLSWSELFGLATRGISGPMTHNPYIGYAEWPMYAYFFVPLGWAVIAFVVGSVMTVDRNDERSAIVWATGIASIFALPALALAMWVTAGTYFTLPPRYGAALIPAVLLVGGYMLRNRVATGLVLAYAGVLMGVGIGLAGFIDATY